MTKKFVQLFKEHEKVFIKEAAKRWHIHRLHSLHATTGCQLYIYAKYYKTNPNVGDELLAICRAIHDSPINSEFRKLEQSETYRTKYEDTIEFLEEVRKEYRDKIKARVDRGNLKLSKYEIECMSHTKILNELLHRGFLLYSEVPNLKESKYVVRIDLNIESYPATVFWNRGFVDKKEAKRIARRFGIGPVKIQKI